MRVLHTSDWHIGRATHHVSRTIDHRAVFAEMADIARALSPSVVIHSGDLFEGPRPKVDEIELAIDALSALASAANCPVVVLCGNHDAPALFRLIARLLGPRSPIVFVDALVDGRAPIHVIDGAPGRLLVGCIPFVRASDLVALDAVTRDGAATRAYADALGGVFARCKQALDERRRDDDVCVIASHVHVGGASISSERALHTSEAYALRPINLPHVDYVALGHLHRPQEVASRSNVFYCGSPLQLDFGEVDDVKCVVVAEVSPGRRTHVERVPLLRGRRLRRVAGSLEEIAALAPTTGDAICSVTVDTLVRIPDLSLRVRAALPDATLVEIIERCAASRAQALSEAALGAVSESNLFQLLEAYVKTVDTRCDRGALLSTFARLHDALGDDGHPPFIEERAFEPPIPHDELRARVEREGVSS